jgi:S1-C subfamily serine protease
MKLYGTEITPKGFSELSAQLDDLQFYYGKGGFLGVSSLLNTLRVRVTPNSAAQEAGMRTGDEIFAVNATPLRSFLELRDALSEFGAGDQVRIAVLRGNQRLVFDVTLKQEP